ncbi:hypothetical protein CAEBREN_11252 [Caenorhabditis brenneri]|uniref:DUF7154 domain-containing protein n=1 Tax=Caenorhabditis brenneri TaxID=135651 RepID=G0NCS3_CAEBE|nr:hypothetical protein CAEBREN_11252 [Caenorhabditis brenneri]
MYRIATETNGIMAYEKDMWMHWTSEYVSEFTSAYTIYAANVKVSGKGSVDLPDIVSPCSTIYCYYTVSMTIQDHGPIDTFQSAKLTWQNTTENTSGYLDDANNYLLSSKGTLYAITDMNLEPLTYSMKLAYAYSDSREEALQIRVYARE